MVSVRFPSKLEIYFTGYDPREHLRRKIVNPGGIESVASTSLPFTP